MGQIFGGAPKPQVQDNSAVIAAAAAAEAKARKEADELKAKQEEEERALRTGRRGRRSLLGTGSETGFGSILGG